jgi:hypothetical protein
MCRDDAIDEPWYEIDFRITRWRCPEGLSGPLLDDVVDAIQETDGLLAESVRLVDRYAYGCESSPKRYVRYSQIEYLKSDFDRMEVRLLLATHGLVRWWASVMIKHKEQLAKLPREIKCHLETAEFDYSIRIKTTEVQLDHNLKQFLKGIQTGS